VIQKKHSRRNSHRTIANSMLYVSALNRPEDLNIILPKPSYSDKVLKIYKHLSILIADAEI